MLPNWPVFNVADMAVVGGAAAIVALSLFGVEPTSAEPDPEGADDAIGSGLRSETSP